ncbi:MAG: signal protein PDZ [Sulfobacillus thermosulfidooxidans]|uniref:endopeptidase La n=1 Tax=Sulfobacillus thermotolerans TaxID=338644 RepID=A0ABM6RT69_9FIRM|nr:S16 family serine protease [Sulfobacillus sp. hq2]AUW94518.1 signal protein PDZ [Sulfobacillus thermotolerans]MCY0908050.1 signal protein PDZ [Sulfobacillus thermotolerans]POB09188.1 signal protein PDZ [Sulfobacillus sp. hq2]PSR36910.1 MAG: signal protein PDZ [Sulfobacillus thermosulfidooxidans]
MKSKRKTLKWIVWVAAIFVAVAVVLWFIPTPYLVITPGVTGNLAQMVHVKNGHPEPEKGELLMVAVGLQQVNELEYLGARLDPNMEILKASYAMGGLNMNQYIQYNESLMTNSQLTAEVAGERLAGLHAYVKTVPGALVIGVLKKGNAQGKLQPGDLITKIGPYSITNPNQVHDIMLKHFTFGEIVPFTVVRKHQTVVVPIRTTHIPHDSAPAIGVMISSLQEPVIPRPVSINSEGIGGPSAGMMFSLEIYSQITGKDLAHGRIVAGTGEITPSGQVQPIGGVAQKVITVHRSGATVFLCPTANYPKALAMARRKGYHMTIYPVSNLTQALHDITKATT